MYQVSGTLCKADTNMDVFCLQRNAKHELFPRFTHDKSNNNNSNCGLIVKHGLDFFYIFTHIITIRVCNTQENLLFNSLG